MHARLPEVAESETRTLFLMKDGEPERAYEFVELFCDERGCDCRRAWIQVFSDEPNVEQPRANISWGWEPAGFYRKWASFHLTADDLAELKGPGLVRMARQSEEAPDILARFREVVLADARYAARIVRHYKAFRALIDVPREPTRAPKAGRNEPCPCGSGRKYKRCCA
jgi:hypothetical protein